MLYAIVLIPVGFIADRVDRPRFLAGGVALWSLLTMGASKAGLTMLHSGCMLCHAVLSVSCAALASAVQ